MQRFLSRRRIGPGRATNGLLSLAVLLAGLVLPAGASEPESRPSNAGARPPAPAPIEPGEVVVASKMVRFCEHLLEQWGFDSRGIPQEQWGEVSFAEPALDRNGDGFISARELASLIARYSDRKSLRMLGVPAAGDRQTATPAAAVAGDRPENGILRGAAAEPAADAELIDTPRRDGRYFVSPSRLDGGVPAWFIERDRDGDGQLTLAEFAPQPSQRQIEEFQRYDLNGDGVITIDEVRRARP